MTDFGAALKQLAGGGDRDDRIKAAIERAARSAGLSYGRAFEIWYGRARRIEPHEKTTILTALTEKRMADERNELHALKLGLARLEARLSQTQAALARAAADGDIKALEAVCGMVSAGG